MTGAGREGQTYWLLRNLCQELAALGHLVQHSLPEAPMGEEELAGLGLLLKRLSAHAQYLAEDVEDLD